MSTIKTMYDERCSKGRAHLQAYTNLQLEQTLKQFSKLFSSLDATFSLLRIVAPSEEELRKTSHAVCITKIIWMSMGFFSPPKPTYCLNKHVINKGHLAD